MAMQIWPGWITPGEVTVISGRHRSGKTAILADIARRVARGKTMPDGTALDGKRRVAYINARPSAEIKRALARAGVDIWGNVHASIAVDLLVLDHAHLLCDEPRTMRELLEEVADYCDATSAAAIIMIPPGWSVIGPVDTLVLTGEFPVKSQRQGWRSFYRAIQKRNEPLAFVPYQIDGITVTWGGGENE